MKILIYGIGGKMGKILCERITELSGDEVFGGVDKFAVKEDFNCPVYESCADLNNETPDCIIDFSVPQAIYDYLPYAVEHKVPCVIATTGFSEADNEYIKTASTSIPIFKSGNMSIGINLLLKLVRLAQQELNGRADVEIIETHHRRKKDSPSGTALMIANTVKSVTENTNILNGRTPESGKRQVGDLGICSVRGGTVAGIHEVKFLMDNEVITISHNAEDRTIFADGAIDAAHFVVKKTAGLYNEIV